MSSIEQRARELLAAEWEADGQVMLSGMIRLGHPAAINNEHTQRTLRAIEAALRLSAGADWQPIETAPKDGTKILIWRDGWDYAPVAWRDAIDCDEGSFGAWVFADHLCLGVGDGCLGWNEDIEDGHMPTHWMPLPAAPRHEPGEVDRG